MITGSNRETNALLRLILNRLSANECLLRELNEKIDNHIRNTTESPDYITIADYAEENGLFVDINEIPELDDEARKASYVLGIKVIETNADGYGNRYAYRRDVLDTVFSDWEDDDECDCGCDGCDFPWV